MSIFYQLSYFLAVGLMLAFAGLIFFRRPEERLVQIFTALVISIAGWVVTLYFYYQLFDPVLVLFVGRLNFAFAELLGYFSFLFAYLFPKPSKRIPKSVHVVLITIVVATVVLTMTTGLVAEDEVIKGISRETIYGPLYFLFPVEFILFALAGIVLLVRKYRRFKESLRRQILIYGLGWGVGASVGIMTNIVLPPLLGNTDIQNLGPVSVLILSLAMGYAVAKQELLEVKLIATEFIVAALLLLFVVNIALATSLLNQVIGGLSMMLSAGLGALLIKSVRNEVRRRNELQVLSEKLQTVNVELRKLGDLKTTMVSIASHQLRGPLGGMRGYMTMFKDGDLGPLTDKQKDIVKMNLSTLSRLLNAVETFLDITRIEAGKMVLRMEDLPLDDAVRDVAHEFEVMTRKKGLELETDIEEHVWVKFDPEKIKHVIFNLVDNAMKYTDAGRIAVSLHKEGGEAVVKVTDTGKGIPAEDLPRLFGKFERGALAVDRGGSGLGLYIVKMLTEMQGGSVDVTSPGVGQGTTFHVRLPLSQGHH